MSTYAQHVARQRGRMAAATRTSLVKDAEKRAALALSASKGECPDSQQHGDAESADCRYIQRVMVLRGLARDGVVSDPSNMLERAQKLCLDEGGDRNLVDKVGLDEPRNAVEADAEKRLLASYGWNDAE